MGHINCIFYYLFSLFVCFPFKQETDPKKEEDNKKQIVHSKSIVVVVFF